MNLENNFFYRLTNTMYYFGLSMLTVIVTCILYMSFSQSTLPDIRNSYITCFNNKKYFLDNFHNHLTIYNDRIYFNKQGSQKICNLCGTINDESKSTRNSKPIHGKLFTFSAEGKLITGASEASSYSEIAKYEQLIEGKAYYGYDPADIDPLGIMWFSAKIKHKPLEWKIYYETIKWCTLISLICYSVLNLMKEVLVYLAFGKKITWNWVLKYIS